MTVVTDRINGSDRALIKLRSHALPKLPKKAGTTSLLLQNMRYLEEEDRIDSVTVGIPRSLPSKHIWKEARNGSSSYPFDFTLCELRSFLERVHILHSVSCPLSAQQRDKPRHFFCSFQF